MRWEFIRVNMRRWWIYASGDKNGNSVVLETYVLATFVSSKVSSIEKLKMVAQSLKYVVVQDSLDVLCVCDL